jgi:hypothetical protein
MANQGSAIVVRVAGKESLATHNVGRPDRPPESFLDAASHSNMSRIALSFWHCSSLIHAVALSARANPSGIIL